jgi:gamma-glutamyltranspeptidase/glutathione hydrolase
MSTRAAVAAGHPATSEAAAEILSEGGNAADAAAAAGLASCVAETVMTGIMGGGHAIWLDAASGKASLLDFFVNVPGLGAAPRELRLLELDVPFGEQLVHYSVGIDSCAVPGVPAGLDELWQRHGTLPWPRIVEPALRLARDGVAVPPAHASCLAMLEPVMTMREGADAYAPGGKLLRAGETLRHQGLERAIETVAFEGARTFYRGTLAEALLELVRERDGLVTRLDLEAYRPVWRDPVEVAFAGARVLTRSGLARLAPVLGRLPALRHASEAERAVALTEALAAPDAEGDTTSFAVVDAEGNACVLTSSLGLGSGDWLPGFGVHLNSMLGETDLLVGPLEPGQRMQSMMAPTVTLDGDGLVLAAGAAGGTRLRSAMTQVLAAVLDEGLDPQAAVDRPRLHPTPDVVHLEEGWSDEAALTLQASGRAVRRWTSRHHYFGGVNVVGRLGPGADPRRSGLALVVETAGRPRRPRGREPTH